jgi:hypothetical protein
MRTVADNNDTMKGEGRERNFWPSYLPSTILSYDFKALTKPYKISANPSANPSVFVIDLLCLRCLACDI